MNTTWYTNKNFRVLTVGENQNFIRLYNENIVQDLTPGSGSQVIAGVFIVRIEPPANVHNGFELTLLLGRKYDSTPIAGGIGLLTYPWNYQKLIPSGVTGFDWQTKPMNIIFPKFTPYTSVTTADTTANNDPDIEYNRITVGNTTLSSNVDSVHYAPRFMEPIDFAKYTSPNGSGTDFTKIWPGNFITHGMPFVTYDPRTDPDEGGYFYKWNKVSTNTSKPIMGNMYNLWEIARCQKLIKLRYIENYVPESTMTGTDGPYHNTKRHYWIVENIIPLAAPDWNLGNDMYYN